VERNVIGAQQTMKTKSVLRGGDARVRRRDAGLGAATLIDCETWPIRPRGNRLRPASPEEGTVAGLPGLALPKQGARSRCTVGTGRSAFSGEIAFAQFCGLLRCMMCRPRLARSLYRSSS
jgi:hypothetical protein